MKYLGAEKTLPMSEMGPPPPPLKHETFIRLFLLPKDIATV